MTENLHATADASDVVIVRTRRRPAIDELERAPNRPGPDSGFYTAE